MIWDTGGPVTITINVNCGPVRPLLRLVTFGPVTEQPLARRPRGEPMLAILTDTQQVEATYGAPKDKKGGPAPIQTGSLTGVTSDATVATVMAVSESPIKILIVAGLPGVCQVWPRADADLGDGVTPVDGEKIDVQVTGGQAVGFGAPTLGTPTEQP